MYLFETNQLIEQLEQVIIDNETAGGFSEEGVNEVFRIMHTIKGSSAMMMYENITTVAHSIEDLFFFLRENSPVELNYEKLSDIALEGLDFIKSEVDKITNKKDADGDPSILVDDIKKFLFTLKENNDHISKDSVENNINQTVNEKMDDKVSESSEVLSLNNYKATVIFEEGCEMEDVRAYSLINNLKDIAEEVQHIPEDIFGDENSTDLIRKNGISISFKSNKSYEELHKFFVQTPLMKDFELTQGESKEEVLEEKKAGANTVREEKMDSPKKKEVADKNYVKSSSSQQSIISVNVNKLDKLMDMVGELVISQAMVVENPDLKGLSLENFYKATQQLQKITNELQDIVMSIRMVPLETTFQKMYRIVRDMSKKLSKEVKLNIIGAETEVDKNIIEHISDPIMHLVRNAIDHGLETPEEREAKGKPKIGTVTLEAKNEGGDVLIIIRDDGKGLRREQILERARKNGLVNRDESEISDKEVFSYIFLPGFSTKDKVTEFSGRGVGMDVVAKNIGTVGGTISVDSVPDKGTAITLKIPLTLAIMDGMTIKVGKSTYTLPIISIQESFRAKEEDIITDPDGNEMIMIRGECYPILRLHQLYKVKTEVTNIPEGIMIMVNHEEKSICIFADELIGEQQVVVKSLPEYIRRFNKVKGISGCTLLGDGSISLILDVAELMNH